MRLCVGTVNGKPVIEQDIVSGPTRQSGATTWTSVAPPPIGRAQRRPTTATSKVTSIRASLSPVRIVAWNCRQGMSEAKQNALMTLRPDVTVIAELKPDYEPPPGWTILRRRADWPRVLGVLAAPGFTLDLHPDDPGLPWLLPVIVRPGGSAPFTLLAVWTVAGDGAPSYERQLEQAILQWDQLAGDPWHRVVLAGDVNASMQGQQTRHALNLELLDDRGLSSAYHRASGCQHGEEAAFTLRWVGRGSVPAWFHCDFVFVSRDLQLGLTAAVGPADTWIRSGMSDHAPVLADLLLPPVVPG